MPAGPPEVLEREYRGYRYVAEDLFEDDAEILEAEGWAVHSTEWWDETGRGLEYTLEVVGFLAGVLGGPGEQRREWLLTVIYHRPPGWDGTPTERRAEPMIND